VRDIEQSDPAGGVLVYILPGADEGSEVVVSLTRPLVDAAVGTATLESSRPNGPRCSPTCTYAEVFLAAG
jgi:hypothetical protein